MGRQMTMATMLRILQEKFDELQPLKVRHMRAILTKMMHFSFRKASVRCSPYRAPANVQLRILKAKEILMLI